MNITIFTWDFLRGSGQNVHEAVNKSRYSGEIVDLSGEMWYTVPEKMEGEDTVIGMYCMRKE